jgi:hypothetical protein
MLDDLASAVLVRRTVMTKLAMVVLLSGLSCCVLLAQQDAAPAPQQTARQALLEMIFSKTPGTLLKHLPQATLAALEKSGALKTMQQYASFTSQIQAQGKNYETFETGPILVSSTDPKTGQKGDVTVESDTLRGDEDDIELSFRGYKDGQPEHVTYMPRIVLVMKKESDIWKLNEVAFTIRLPLADPDFLKSIGEKMKPQLAAQSAFTPQVPTFASQQTPAVFGSDAQVLAAMRSILTAEVTYTASYPTVGFTCTISDLDGFGGGQPNEHQAMLISSSLASGKRYGYVFGLSGCAGTPATSFELTAAPGGNSLGHRAFCADESGTIRSSSDGNPATCQAHGTPVQ